jgi:hypothetical protein
MLFEDKSLEAILEGIRRERLEVERQLDTINEELKDYYENRQLQDKYIAQYGFQDDQDNTDLPMMAINLTEKIINKISLTYKYQPERYILDESEEQKNLYNEWFAFNEEFGLGFKYAERYKNLLSKVLHRVHFNATNKQWYSYVETNYEAHFVDDDPLHPYAYSYPYKQVLDRDGNVKEDWWIFWSDEHMFYYIPGTEKTKTDPDFEEWVNPFSIIPAIELRNKYPVDQYESVGAIDLIRANQNVNIALNNLNMMIHFQAFDQLVISGAQANEVKRVKTGTAEAIVNSSIDTRYELLGYDPKINECIEAIRMEIQSIAYVYNLKIGWSIDSSPVSGFSLLVQNIDLSEQREDDIELAKLHEKKMYKVISTMQDYYSKFKMLGDEPKLPLDGKISVDFEESLHLPINQAEEIQRKEFELKHNVITEVDLIIENNPDMTPEEAEEKYKRNKRISGNLSAVDQVRAGLENQGVVIESNV